MSGKKDIVNALLSRVPINMHSQSKILSYLNSFLQVTSLVKIEKKKQEEDVKRIEVFCVLRRLRERSRKD